jgi:YqaJ-like viral recombinase domain
MAIVHRVEQGSVEWHRVRLGIPTASQFHRIITPATAVLSKQARPYLYRLVAERMLSEAFEDNLERVEWIEDGKLREPRAMQTFMQKLRVGLDRVGFITDDRHRFGCSPDALIVGRPEAVEIKCPQPWTQMGRLLDGMDEKYRPQVQGQLFVGELDRAHFYSWHEQMPPFYVMTTRDDEYIAKLEAALLQFVAALDEATNQARKMGRYVPRIGPATGGMGS